MQQKRTAQYFRKKKKIDKDKVSNKLELFTTVVLNKVIKANCTKNIEEITEQDKSPDLLTFTEQNSSTTLNNDQLSAYEQLKKNYNLLITRFDEEKINFSKELKDKDDKYEELFKRFKENEEKLEKFRSFNEKLQEMLLSKYLHKSPLNIKEDKFKVCRTLIVSVK